MLNAVVGIDVSKNDLSIAIIINNKTHQINICNNMIGFKDFSKWLKQNKVVKVKACMGTVKLTNQVYKKAIILNFSQK